MRTIIKKGYKTKPEDIIYQKKCKTCGCKFLYQKEDIKFNYLADIHYVYCPDCEYSCNIIFKKKYKGD